MADLNAVKKMYSKLQNWNNFCRYHAVGNWHGVWTRYSPDGKVIQSFKGIRSFSVNADGNEINHQNYFTYADGTIENKNIGSYTKPDTTLLLLGKSFSVLFLDNSYSWGNTELGANSPFGFETGFRCQDKRASATVLYNQFGQINQITIIPEYLAGFVEQSHSSSASNICSDKWFGIGKSMLSDLTTTSPIETAWSRLEDLDDNYLTLHFHDGISISCPQQIDSGKEFFLAVDWLVHPGLLQRGIRHFDTYGFRCLTLEVFTQAS